MKVESLLQLLSEAWERGYTAGWDDCSESQNIQSEPDKTTNPYKSAHEVLQTNTLLKGVLEGLL